MISSILSIMAVNILLSGDNAMVIAMACKDLPERQRRLGMIFGALGAVGARLALLAVAASLLVLPGAKLVGGLALLVICYKLLAENESEGSPHVHESLLSAILTIVVADISMSLDNVLAVSAAAHGDFGLTAIGVLASFPIIMGGAALIGKAMDRFPWLLQVGVLFLLYLAFSMILEDSLVLPFLPEFFHGKP